MKDIQLTHQAPEQDAGSRAQEFEAAAFAAASAGDRLESVLADLHASAAAHSGFSPHAFSAQADASGLDKAAAFALAAADFAANTEDMRHDYTLLVDADGSASYIYEYAGMQGGQDTIRGFTHVQGGAQDELRFENMLHDGERELDNLLANARWDDAAQAAVMENDHLRVGLTIDQLQATLSVTGTSPDGDVASQTVVLENFTLDTALPQHAASPEETVQLMQEIVKITS